MPLEIKVPTVGESVSEVEVGEWLKAVGDAVRKDEAVVVLETDKATVEVYAPADGILGRILKPRGSRVAMGEVIGEIEPGAMGPPSAPVDTATDSGAESSADTRAAAAGAAAVSSADGLAAPAAAAGASEPGSGSEAGELTGERGVAAAAGGREERAVSMNLIRRKIAERLVEAHNTMALLTTFNEVDMTAVTALRRACQERFRERYQVKLGIMSFFVKAVIEGLKECPALNAEIRGAEVVYRNYYDLGIAIGGGRGLVVPVLRNAERLSFAGIEAGIADFAGRARQNQLRPEELAGGTFTITNGGVYGSLLSTPLINPPQSGVLGLHAIQERPVAREGQVVIRPMMYVALTYDHRIVDGREAVTFLRRVKELVEEPARLLIEA